jgi:FkbM family methyltransferase
LDLTQGIDLYIFLFSEFEVRTAAALRRIVRPGNCVLDIGANVGAHTLALAKLAGPSGRVFAFEPTDFAFDKLKTTLSLNPELSRSVTAVQAFLGGPETSGAPSFIYSSWPLVQEGDLNPTHGGEAKATAGAAALVLDRFCESESIDRVDVIKLDVDGYECDVLSGGREMIGRSKPTFVMEIAPSALRERGTSLDALLECLVPFGYRFYRLDESPLPSDVANLRALIRDGESINVIARAADSPTER